jgi:hypothetical protein
MAHTATKKAISVDKKRSPMAYPWALFSRRFAARHTFADVGTKLV